jgi:hypothetical protein
MVDGTIAVPLALIATPDGRKRRALCPACHGGRLHPYYVQLSLEGFYGMAYADGWVAKCAGSNPQYGETDLVKPLKPCGFSMPLTAHRATEFDMAMYRAANTPPSTEESPQ